MVFFLPALYFPLNFGSPLLSGLFFLELPPSTGCACAGAMLPQALEDLPEVLLHQLSSRVNFYLHSASEFYQKDELEALF
jgi:hypothetical protein